MKEGGRFLRKKIWDHYRDALRHERFRRMAAEEKIKGIDKKHEEIRDDHLKAARRIYEEIKELEEDD